MQPTLPKQNSKVSVSLKDKTNITANLINIEPIQKENIKANKTNTIEINNSIIKDVPEEIIMRMGDQHEILINKILYEEEEFLKNHKNHIDIKVE